MADAAVEMKDTALEEVTSTKAAKESQVKKSPANKVPEPESNSKAENSSCDVLEETPAENGDESNDVVENGEGTENKKGASVKRKSAATDNEEAGNTTSEKKTKVAEEAPPIEKEAA